MLTIFTVPKPFEGHSRTIQLSALQSWTLLRPRCEIILCGDEQGVKEAAAEFNVGHLPSITCNEYGTPLLDSVFEQAAQSASHRLLCYVNADIIFLSDLLEAVQRIRFDQFLVIGQRWDVDLEHQWDFGQPDWDSRLVEFVTSKGVRHGPSGIDYFLFTANGRLEKLPAFAVGRPKWDGWFIYNARRLGIPVVDVTRVCMPIHQNHGYSHIPKKVTGRKWEGPEALQSRRLSHQSLGVTDHQFNIRDATHVLTSRALLPALSPMYLRQRWFSAAVLHPAMRPLVQVLNPLLRPPQWLKSRLKK